MHTHPRTMIRQTGVFQELQIIRNREDSSVLSLAVLGPGKSLAIAATMLHADSK